MVTIMDLVEPKSNSICDGRSSTLVQSAISQRSIDLEIMSAATASSTTTTTTTTTTMAHQIDGELSKKVLKLKLKHPPQQRVLTEKGRISLDEADEKSFGLKSPKSPMSTTSIGKSSVGGRSSTMSHQTSITSQVDVIVEDRKALRDALYQGIFHRHRRTIFAVGSFLRMLRTRNSQYNTIRSTSEGDDDTR